VDRRNDAAANHKDRDRERGGGLSAHRQKRGGKREDRW